MPNRLKESYAVEPRKLKSGRWKGRVVIYEADTGKRREMTKTFDVQKQAKNWGQEQALLYRQDPNRKPPSEETLEAYMERWLAIKKTLNLTDKTLSSYRQMAAHSIRELGDKPLKSLQPLQIQLFYAELNNR